MDEIQADLERWHRDRDKRAGLRAARALAREWTGPARAMLRADEATVDDAVQEMLILLVMPRDGKPPRALAPPDAGNPRAWRRKVLTNALISWMRKRSALERAQEAHRHGLTRDDVRELKERRRTGPVDLPSSTQVPAEDDYGTVADRQEIGIRRETVGRLLPTLALRRRVAVALTLGMDATPWAVPLAQELEEDPGVVTSRLAEVSKGLPAHLAIYPDGGGEESFRKAVERGVQDLRRLLAEEGT